MTEIIYGSQPLGPRVRGAVPLSGHRLQLTFSNNEERIFDASPLLAFPAFAPLKDESFFRLVTVDYGTVCWPGDIDYCPDTLYAQSVPN